MHGCVDGWGRKCMDEGKLVHTQGTMEGAGERPWGAWRGAKAPRAIKDS